MIHDADGHYAVLGVDPSASEAEIKAAYKTLTRKWHPDVNPAPEAAQMMALINMAKDVLFDPVKRQDYDRTAPRPPVLTQSQYSVDLSGKAAEVTVTVTSSREIHEFVPDRLSGPGWVVEITSTDPKIATLLFLREGTVQAQTGRVTDTFVALVDGARLSLDVCPKCDAVPRASTTGRGATMSGAGATVGNAATAARGWVGTFVARHAPLVALVLVVLVAGARRASEIQSIQLQVPGNDLLITMTGMLRANVGLALAALMGLALLKARNLRSWASPAVVTALWVVMWATGVNFVFGCVLATLTAFGVYAARIA